MIQWQNFNSELEVHLFAISYYTQKGQQGFEIALKGEAKPCALCRFVHVIKFQKMYWVWYVCCATQINLLLLIFANSGMTIQARRSFQKKATSLATNETSEAANLIRSFAEPEVSAKQAQICDFLLLEGNLIMTARRILTSAMIYQDHHQHPPPMRAHASNLFNYNLVFYTVYMITPEAMEESNRTREKMR